jgi:hypothetical protein
VAARDGGSRDEVEGGGELGGELGGGGQAERGSAERAGQTDDGAFGDDQAAERSLTPAEGADRGEFGHAFADVEEDHVGDGVAEQRADNDAAEGEGGRGQDCERGHADRQADRADGRPAGGAQHVHHGHGSDAAWLAARRTPSTGGLTEATGSAPAASQAGTSPAIDATATAIGTASAARPCEACRPSADDSGSAAAARFADSRCSGYQCRAVPE